MYINQLWNIKHPESSLQLSWYVWQLGIVILPLYPTIGAILLGFASLFAWLRKYKVLIRRPLHWGLAIFSGLLFISAIFAWQKQDAFLGIFNFVPFFLMLAATSVIVQTSSQLRQVAWILILTSLPICWLGFAQLFLQLYTPPVWEQIFGWSIIAGGNPTGRMSSVFTYANVFAGYTVIMFILALGLWLDQYQQISDRVTKQGVNNINLDSPSPVYRGGNGFALVSVYKTVYKSFCQPHLLILMTAVICNLICLILSNSRNAWLIAIAACISYAVYQGWRIIVGATASIATSILLAAYAPSPIADFFRRFVPEFFWKRLNDQYFPDRPVVLLRTTQWNFTLKMMRDRPLTGWGLRNFTPLYQSVEKVWLGHPHNLYLMLAGEVGIPATLLFIGILIWILISSLQVLRRVRKFSHQQDLILFTYIITFLGLICFNIFDVSLFDFRLNALFWSLIGALTGNIYYLKAKKNLFQKYL